jgi:hypothetical protein
MFFGDCNCWPSLFSLPIFSNHPVVLLLTNVILVWLCEGFGAADAGGSLAKPDHTEVKPLLVLGNTVGVTGVGAGLVGNLKDFSRLLH